MEIKLNLVSEVYEFVEAAQKHSSEIKLSQGSYTVDGKSMLGIFVLNLREPIKCVVANGDYDSFEKFEYKI